MWVWVISAFLLHFSIRKLMYLLKFEMKKKEQEKATEAATEE